MLFIKHAGKGEKRVQYRVTPGRNEGEHDDCMTDVNSSTRITRIYWFYCIEFPLSKFPFIDDRSRFFFFLCRRDKGFRGSPLSILFHADTCACYARWLFAHLLTDYFRFVSGWVELRVTRLILNARASLNRGWRRKGRLFVVFHPAVCLCLYARRYTDVVYLPYSFRHLFIFFFVLEDRVEKMSEGRSVNPGEHPSDSYVRNEIPFICVYHEF